MQYDISILPIYQKAKDWPNGSMDIRQIRRENMRRLIAEFGTAAELAKEADTDPSYISQLIGKNAKRKIGDDLARRLEKAGNKEHGWMDQNHGRKEVKASNAQGKEAALTRQEEAIIEIFRQFPPSVRRRFLDHLHAFAAACGIDVKRVA